MNVTLKDNSHIRCFWKLFALINGLYQNINCLGGLLLFNTFNCVLRLKGNKKSCMLFAKKETRQNAVRDGFNHGQDPDPSPNPDNDDDNNDDDDDNDVLVIGQVVMLQIS